MSADTNHERASQQVEGFRYKRRRELEETKTHRVGTCSDFAFQLNDWAFVWYTSVVTSGEPTRNTAFRYSLIRTPTLLKLASDVLTVGHSTRRDDRAFNNLDG